MKFKKFLLSTLSRILRFVGILALIYVSMVFYLALTERRNAYPRAITHKEARSAIEGKVEPIHCTLSDKTELKGFSRGSKNAPLLLYYPEADEDVAQFFAEVEELPHLNLVAFNYRGSAENKGSPSAKNYLSDAREIYECASQIKNAPPDFLVGRAAGGILAAHQLEDFQHLILIDPIESIAAGISQKYRLLYPKFLVRAKEELPLKKLQTTPAKITLLRDRKRNEETSLNVQKLIPNAQIVIRGEKSFQEILEKITKTSSLNPEN